jgi:hypothetical protein
VFSVNRSILKLPKNIMDVTSVVMAFKRLADFEEHLLTNVIVVVEPNNLMVSEA